MTREGLSLFIGEVVIIMDGKISLATVKNDPGAFFAKHAERYDLNPTDVAVLINALLEAKGDLPAQRVSIAEEVERYIRIAYPQTTTEQPRLPGWDFRF